jgi:uncharacterized membrane protein YqhA
MKEEKVAILAGLGMATVVILATVFLKKLFNNMSTSGALFCIFIVVGILYLVVLLVMEYIGYRARKKQGIFH